MRALGLLGFLLAACGGSDQGLSGGAGAEVCGNALDDDGDGLVDCVRVGW